MQYDFVSKDKKSLLRLGAYANLQQNLSAKRTEIQETISYDGNGGFINIDTVSFTKDVAGKVQVPATYGVGFTYVTRSLVFGADLELTNWSDYRYYNQTDDLQNNYTIKVGGQYQPAKDNTPPSKYWSFVKYRAGLYYGSDYVKVNNKSRSDYGLTVGAGLPLTSLARTAYAREVVVLNTGLEIGARGSKQSQSLRENIVRFSIGISMNARWFFKPKYD